MDDDFGCVIGVAGRGEFAVVASGTPIVHLDSHRLLAISGNQQNRARFARTMCRRWKGLTGVPYPDTATVADLARELLDRGHSVEALVVGYNQAQPHAAVSCVGPALPRGQFLFGAAGRGAEACRAVLRRGYRDTMSSSDVIELVESCIAEIRRLGVPGAAGEFAVQYVDRWGAAPVGREVRETMAIYRQMALEVLKSHGLALNPILREDHIACVFDRD
ncbi:proteasome subunit beta type-2-B-like isoform X1 [Aegilops tauschii subsp. strangulata]|uniref:Uncharacterized protein n=2 Tax=Aegilops tauschii TaxID=37682 RepID=A0A453M1M1_AEGTS|nr:uncharacterized protein LOC123123159 isoform X1 [Triticum aestivum]XP_045085184.1 uncharacterized protein LOC120965352 isoform X1 [Aegilops tauschii subsp. strangulata]